MDNVLILCQLCIIIIDRKAVFLLAQTTISVRMDEQLKKDFDRICDELGMTMSTAVIMLAKKMTREQKLPFEVAVDPFYSKSNMEHLRKVKEKMDIDEGKGVLLTLEEFENLCGTSAGAALREAAKRNL